MPRERRSRGANDSLGYGSFSFNQPRKRRNAKRGMVSNVLSGQSSAYAPSGRYARGGHSPNSTQSFLVKSRLRTLLLLVAILLVVCGVTFFVAKSTYYASVNSNLALKDSGVKACLTESSSSDEYSILYEIDLGTKYVSGSSDSKQYAFIYQYVNVAKQTSYLLSFPVNTQVSQKGSDVQTLLKAVQSSDSSFVSGVKEASSLEVNHFVKIDEDGLCALVDYLGGVSVYVSEEVDDPNAGTDYIATGWQTLNASQSLTFLRADNFKNTTTTQCANQREYLKALITALIQPQGMDFTLSLDKISKGFTTDISAQSLSEVADALRPISSDKWYSAQIPGYDYNQGSTQVYMISASDLSTYVSAMKNGEQINSVSGTSNVDPSTVSVLVKNGSGIDGGAATITELLTSKGYNASSGGNTESYAYSETLVIYIDSTKADAAKKVVSDLGCGRVIDGTGFYSFDADVEVILGKDWKPTT